MEYWNNGKTEKKKMRKDRGRFALFTHPSIIPVFHYSILPFFLSSTLLVFCSPVIVFLSGAEVQAATCTATGGTNWATATWSGCTGPPTNADDAIINSGINLTITTAAVCGSLTIGSTRNNTTLTVGSGGSLSVTTAGGRTGNLSINPGGYTNRTYTLAVGTQSATIDGTVTLSTNTSVITVHRDRFHSLMPAGSLGLTGS
jgi:hypothetical protein